MQRLLHILRFGWPYMRRYWRRFALGVALAWVFALSNGVLLGAIKTVLDRMAPPAPAAIVASAEQSPAPTAYTRLKAEALRIQKDISDQWLPALGKRPDARQVVGLLFLFPFLAIFRGFSGYLSSYCLAWVSERVVNDLRIDVLKKLNTLSLDFFNRSTMGDLLTRVSGDTFAVNRCLGSGLSDLIKEPLTILFVLGGLFYIAPQLTFIALVFFPLMVLPIIFFGRKVRKAATAGLNSTITQSSLLVEIFSGIRVIKAFNQEQDQEARFRKQSFDLVHHDMRMVRARELINPMIEAASTLGFSVILLYIVFHQITLTDMITVLAGAAFIYTPVKKLAAIHVLLQQTDAAVHRLIGIMAEQPTVKEPAAPAPLSKFQKAITIENLSFTYGPRPVLQDVNLAIPRGSRIGVAGESGSGKSTLVNLLFRFYDPAAGAVQDRRTGHPRRLHQGCPQPNGPRQPGDRVVRSHCG